MAETSITTFVGPHIEEDDKWSKFVDGGDGLLYGIPYDARRVVKFNPLDKSLTEIGPDLGDGRYKWRCGVRDNNGNIYCAPFFADRFLKISTNDGTVETLDDVELPETGGGLWTSGALVASDNSIYYMPLFASRIMRLNADNDTCSSVGDHLGEKPFKYVGTVVGNDDCVYGIPDLATRIVKYDPADPDTTCTEECLPSDKEWADSFSGNSLPLFMVAASCENCVVSVIYHLLRRNVHDALSGNDVGASN
jgi:hypothetical protein